MSNTKKEWQEPRLIVMVRNHPEEAVLQHCKTNTQLGASGQGFGNVFGNCINQQHGERCGGDWCSQGFPS